MRRAYLDDADSLAKAAEELIGEIVGFDASLLLANEYNVCFTDGKDWILLEFDYEGHYFPHMLMRSGGKEALRKAREVLQTIVDHYPWIHVIQGSTPVDRRHARWFNRQMGFTSYGIYNTPLGPEEVFHYKIERSPNGLAK